MGSIERTSFATAPSDQPSSLNQPSSLTARSTSAPPPPSLFSPPPPSTTTTTSHSHTLQPSTERHSNHKRSIYDHPHIRSRSRSPVDRASPNASPRGSSVDVSNVGLTDAELLHKLLDKTDRLMRISAKNQDEISTLETRIARHDKVLNALESQIGTRTGRPPRNHSSVERNGLATQNEHNTQLYSPPQRHSISPLYSPEQSDSTSDGQRYTSDTLPHNASMPTEVMVQSYAPTPNGPPDMSFDMAHKNHTSDANNSNNNYMDSMRERGAEEQRERNREREEEQTQFSHNTPTTIANATFTDNTEGNGNADTFDANFNHNGMSGDPRTQTQTRIMISRTDSLNMVDASPLTFTVNARTARLSLENIQQLDLEV